jgi:hypothetical protein
MDALNAATRKLFGLAWAPFDRLPPWVGLLVLGVAFGVVALIAMKYTTNAKRVERFKDRYQGHILAIKLFRDSFTVVVSSLVKTLGWVGCYLGEQFKPALLLLVPFMLLFAQIELRLGCGRRPRQDGARDRRRRRRQSPDAAVELTLPRASSRGEAGPRAARPPLRGRRRAARRGRARAALQVRGRDGREDAPRRRDGGRADGLADALELVWDQVLYPGEAAFGAGSAFTKIELAYPVRPLPFLGFDLSFGSEMGMMLLFVAITIVAAFGLKGVFGVTI